MIKPVKQKKENHIFFAKMNPWKKYMLTHSKRMENIGWHWVIVILMILMYF